MKRTEENLLQNKNSFILYLDQAEIFDNLSDKDAGILIKTILHFVNTGEVKKMSPLLNMAFIPIKQSLKRDLDKWRKIKETRAISGSKGGKQKQANLAKGSKRKQKVANVAVSDSVNVNVINNKKINKKKYGEFSNVLLADNEYQKLIDKHDINFISKCIEKLSAYKHSNGKTYKSDYAAMNTWVVDSIKEKSGTKETKGEANERKAQEYLRSRGVIENSGASDDALLQLQQGF